MLDWNFPAIKYFLREKIRRLPRAFRMQPEHDGVRGWLGRDSIYNRPRGVTEVLEEYLLRRTRQIPRDVVLLGNELCAEVEAAKGDRSTSVSPDAIRKAVAKVSKAFADEQISVCGNHLASDTMPPSAGRQNFSDFY